MKKTSLYITIVVAALVVTVVVRFGPLVYWTTFRPITIVAAARTGDLELVKKVLYRTKDINAIDNGYYGQTALMQAVQWEFPVVVNFLLANGANPNIASGEGITALDLAMQCGDETNRMMIINALVEHGGTNGMYRAAVPVQPITAQRDSNRKKPDFPGRK